MDEDFHGPSCNSDHGQDTRAWLEDSVYQESMLCGGSASRDNNSAGSQDGTQHHLGACRTEGSGLEDMSQPEDSEEQGEEHDVNVRLRTCKRRRTTWTASNSIHESNGDSDGETELALPKRQL